MDKNLRDVAGHTAAGPVLGRILALGDVRHGVPFAVFAAGFAIVVGVAVLAGWAFDVPALQSIRPGMAAMRPTTALCILLSGVATLLGHWALHGNPPGALAVPLRRAVFALAGICTLAAAASFVRDLSGVVPDAIVPTADGAEFEPMSQVTAASFLLQSLALVLCFSRSIRIVNLQQLLATTSVLIACVTVLGHLLGVRELYHVAPFRSIALHSGVTFAILGVGLLSLRSREGWVRHFTMDTGSARLGRRLVLSLCVVVPALAWIRLQGQYLGWYETEFGLALLVALILLIVAALTWYLTRAASRGEIHVRQLNLAYAVLSEINALISRVHVRDELFKQACRIAVNTGGFRFVWIGTLDTHEMCFTPIAWAGAERGILDRPEYRNAVRNQFGAEDRIAATVLAGAPVAVNEVAREADRALREELLNADIRSMAVFPLVIDAEVIGAIALHAATAAFFGPSEMRLLRDLAGDLSFAIDQLRKEQALHYLAYFDSLTGLANRELFQDRLHQRALEARRTQSGFGLAIVDVAHFRSYNDSLGRGGGDDLLKQIARRLENLAGADYIGRVGSNQFAVILARNERAGSSAHVYKARILDCFERSFLAGGGPVNLTVHIGIAVFPQDDGEDALFGNAEAALKKARSIGETCVFFDPLMHENASERLRFETLLRTAVKREQFVLHYLPKVELANRRVTGIEGLIRWESPELGLVAPGRFIPLLEESGLIREVGAWSLRQAMIDGKRFVDQALPRPRISLNVSPVQLRQADFVDTLRAGVGSSGAAARIDLEVTESLIMDDVDASIAKLREVRAMGIGVAIDDFGTGNSSLAYLARLPVNSVKIDRSFIVNIEGQFDARDFVAKLIALVHSLGHEVVAEGVEAEEQVRILQSLHCDTMQGYVVSRPLPLAEVMNLTTRLGCAN